MYLAVWSAAPPGVRYSVLDGVEKLAKACGSLETLAQLKLK
jgi:hypothetical protein